MIQVKTVDIKSTSAIDAAGEYHFAMLNDAAATLRIDSLPVMEIDPNFVDVNFGSAYHFYISGNGGNVDGRHSSYFKFANSFSYMDYGIFTVNYAMSPCRVNSSCITNNGDRVNVIPIHDGNNYRHLSAIAFGGSITDIVGTPYFLYNGTDVAYFNTGATHRGVVFAKLKSIDDPSVFKYIVICCTSTDMGANAKYYNNYTHVSILHSSGYAYEYTENINNRLAILNKAVIERFVFDGYYSDELFIFDGLCPDGIFTINNNTYINIGFNLYMKINTQ